MRNLEWTCCCVVPCGVCVILEDVKDGVQVVGLTDSSSSHPNASLSIVPVHLYLLLYAFHSSSVQCSNRWCDLVTFSNR